MVKILNQQNSIANKFIAQMRDKQVQCDSMRFRRNMERVGEIMAYEISKTLNYTTKMVETPLGIAAVECISDKIVVATILRAGLPFHQGFLNFFDDAENGFVSAFRKSRPDGSFIYTPKKNKVGVDSFTYTATDASGKVSREATVTIQILKPTDARQYTDTVGLDCRFEAEWLKNNK